MKVKGLLQPKEKKQLEVIKAKYKDIDYFALRDVTFIKKEGKIQEVLMNFGTGVCRDSMHYYECLTMFAKIQIEYDGDFNKCTNLKLSQVHSTLGYPSWKYLGNYCYLYTEECLDYRKQTDLIIFYRLS